MKKYKTIKELVVSRCSLDGLSNYEALTKEILKYFPFSKWNKKHFAWYRNQIKHGKIKVLVRPLEAIESRGGKSSKKGTKKTTEMMDISEEIISKIRKIIKVAREYEMAVRDKRKLGITAEVGEVLACYHLGLKLVLDTHLKGFDALDKKSKKVQIKSRRSESEGLPNDVGRIGTFSLHPFDYALLVLLDHNYELREIWRADHKELKPLIEKHKRRNPNLSSFKKISKKVFPCSKK